MDIYVNPGNLSFTEAVNSQIFWIYRKRGTTKPLFRIGGLMEKAQKIFFRIFFRTTGIYLADKIMRDKSAGPGWKAKALKDGNIRIRKEKMQPDVRKAQFFQYKGGPVG